MDIDQIGFRIEAALQERWRWLTTTPLCAPIGYLSPGGIPWTMRDVSHKKMIMFQDVARRAEAVLTVFCSRTPRNCWS